MSRIFVNKKENQSMIMMIKNMFMRRFLKFH